MNDPTYHTNPLVIKDLPGLSKRLFISAFFLYLFSTGIAVNAEQHPSKSNIKLQGKVSHSNELKGSGQFDNATLILQKGIMDDSILTISAKRQSLEMNIKWDKWKNKVRKKVWKNFNVRFGGGDAFYIGPFFLKYGENPAIDLPMGAFANYSYEITRDRRIKNARIDKSSGDSQMNNLVLRSILSLDKKRMLRFPKGSQREKVRISDSMEIVKKGGFHYRHYNDIETVNID